MKKGIKNKKIIALIVVICIGIIAFFATGNIRAYSSAKSAMKNGDYKEAISKFKKLKGYKNSKRLLDDSKYGYAKQLMRNHKYEEAQDVLANASSRDKISDLDLECYYEDGKYNYKNGNFDDALDCFQDLDYKDSESYVEQLQGDHCLKEFVKRYNATMEFVKSTNSITTGNKITEDSFDEDETGVATLDSSATISINNPSNKNYRTKITSVKYLLESMDKDTWFSEICAVLGGMIPEMSNEEIVKCFDYISKQESVTYAKKYNITSKISRGKMEITIQYTGDDV